MVKLAALTMAVVTGSAAAFAPATTQVRIEIMQTGEQFKNCDMTWNAIIVDETIIFQKNETFFE